MLILNKLTQFHNSKGAWEPITKFKVRAGNDVSKMLDIITEINLYLPDDWRLTRSKNNFSILVSPSSGDPYILKGNSFRVDGHEILHIIDSIFKPGFFDQYDLRAAGIGRTASIDRKIKRENPDILVPNLYFFQPRPDDSASPLFARQYEKIKLNKKGQPLGTQYHRIHPLYKWGLDLDHFRWVKWDINGNVQYADYPEEDYHGADYWIIPSLKNEDLRGKKEDYLNNFSKLLQEHNIQKPAPPHKVSTPYEYEYKFLVREKTLTQEQLSGKIKEILNREGLIIVSSGKPREQLDTYFDDNELHLFRHGVSFRFRESSGKIARITLKARPSNTADQDKSKGEYRRIEEEMTVSISQKDALFKGERITALPYRLIPYVAPDCSDLKPVVIVKTKRLLLEVKNDVHQYAEVCIDVVNYERNRTIVGPDIEIEIESKGMGTNEIAHIAAKIKRQLNLDNSKESKYERALSLLK